MDNGEYDNELDDIYEHPRDRTRRIQKQKAYKEKSQATLDNIMDAALEFGKNYNKILAAVALEGSYAIQIFFGVIYVARQI